MHMGQRDVLFTAVRVDAARGLRRQPEQRLDRARGLRARLQFQYLAEQCQRHDHCRRLEVGADPSVEDERCREPLRRDRGRDAVDECHADAEPDQRPHVRAAIDDGLCAAHEKRLAGPQDDRGRNQELCPTQQRGRQTFNPVPAHRQRHDDDRQWQRPPEAPRKVAQFRVLVVVQRRHLRLERHAADRAVAGCRLADLWVHRAGVDRRTRWLRGSCGCRVSGVPKRGTVMRAMLVCPVLRAGLGVRIYEAFGGRFELREAMRAAKVIALSSVLVLVRCVGGYAHSANRIFQNCRVVNARAALRHAVIVRVVAVGCGLGHGQRTLPRRGVIFFGRNVFSDRTRDRRGSGTLDAGRHGSAPLDVPVRRALPAIH
jgi:predicted  nucleic acid-binding Zn-ribbon protein